MQKLTDRLAVALLIVLFLGAMAWVGSVESEDEMTEERRYCEMVKSGAWPNYDNRECK